ncbi:hypothetical protein HOP50_14g71440 [Chloropicon primus]|uniref:Uncharacterized protein n=1 Tax=Chloropicon primus TaxID=1764295 RepID=A0A5B8MYB1_9CHLO|nr:hypothetical protein A3770_14p71230 [Chloropicon primus]UPR03814.1 hypothetical protein HOP50_14g71440 [Chloropicon primus]|eukprot:QDZ24605.1 hypothetical protein A3770_14p71230 [Chloropicon primus]
MVVSRHATVATCGRPCCCRDALRTTTTTRWCSSSSRSKTVSVSVPRLGSVVARAGKGFGKPKSGNKNDGDDEGKDPSSSSTTTSPVVAEVVPPRKGSSWASEVREQQQAYETDDGSPSGDAPKGPAKMPAEQYKKYDENFVTVLAFLFVGIFAEGLLVAGSGFLPEDVDNFIVNTVYPAFTPTLGVFLLVSVCYGLFKTKVEPE